MTGQELRRMRLKIGLSQENLARHFRVTMSTIYNWEHGRYPISELVAIGIREKFRQLEAGEVEI